MNIRFTTMSSLVLSFGLLATLACSETADEATNLVNCHSVCERYSDCVDPDVDVDACTDRCEDEADASEAREERLEACDSCIEDRSCSSAGFNCGTECGGIVP